MHQSGSRTLSEDELALLRLFAFKVKHNLTEAAFNDLPIAFPGNDISSWQVTSRHIQCLSGFKPVRYDCCPDSCVCYTGPYEKYDACPVCGKAWYKPNSTQPRSYFAYLPIIPRLRAMVANPRLAKEMRYRSQYEDESQEGIMEDIFDGDLYKSLLNKLIMVAGKNLPFHHFSDHRDIALGVSMDGVSVFKKRSKTCLPLLLFNYNLPPDTRFHMNNIIPAGIIPGPKKPVDMDSFLHPLVQELVQLEIGTTAFDGLSKVVFLLHAHLLVVSGDIPAVAVLMRMKGHNGFSPCRMCKIVGVKASSSNTYYVPLHRRNVSGSSSGPYDPSNLPMRTHNGFIDEANQVQFARTLTLEQNLATEFGIKGIPLLSSLGSLSFPASFPYDFMHLVWENLIPNLVLFWTGCFKELRHEGMGYSLDDSVWTDICRISAEAGDTIPAAFGCRVPDMSTQRWQLTAESWEVWTLYIAPIVLYGWFTEEKYYKHFQRLVHLLKLCLEYELPMEKVAKIENGFIRWVEDYERSVIKVMTLNGVLTCSNAFRFYYQHNISRLSACPLTIHALLHVGSSIRANGPVWTNWAFPMERYCGDVVRHVRNRRYLYIGINNYATSSAQLAQLKLRYDLDEELSFGSQDNDAGHIYDGCK